MTERQYRRLERALEAFFACAILATAAVLLLGVYTLADLVF